MAEWFFCSCRTKSHPAHVAAAVFLFWGSILYVAKCQFVSQCCPRNESRFFCATIMNCMTPPKNENLRTYFKYVLDLQYTSLNMRMLKLSSQTCVTRLNKKIRDTSSQHTIRTVSHTYTCYMLDYKTVFISLAWLLRKLRQNTVRHVQLLVVARSP